MYLYVRWRENRSQLKLAKQLRDVQGGQEVRLVTS
jgi:hypothetical protein